MSILNEIPYSFPDPKPEKKGSIFTIGEMYCGPGGMGLAAKKAKLYHAKQTYSFQHLWATDYHKDSCLTFQNNIPLKRDKKFKVICEDIRKINLENLPYVDGFLYGFPCNDFSLVGETKGLDGKFGPLYRYGVSYMNIHNPKFFVAENVSGISGANSGHAFEKILTDLELAGRNGYNLSVHLYKFEQYGIPQARHRYIIVGFRKDLKLKFKIPAPSNKMKTVKEALTQPPILANAKNREKTIHASTVVERLKHIKPGDNAWSDDIPDHLKLNVKETKLSMIYKRLDPDKPSYTITGSGGGGTHVYHWDEPRALSNRERARIQTFPDNFVFFGSKESVRRQIGMAIPVDGIKIILNSILKTFAGVRYKSIDPGFSNITQKRLDI